jgi:hypothetical protein
MRSGDVVIGASQWVWGEMKRADQGRRLPKGWTYLKGVIMDEP